MLQIPPHQNFLDPPLAAIGPRCPPWEMITNHLQNCSKQTEENEGIELIYSLGKVYLMDSNLSFLHKLKEFSPQKDRVAMSFGVISLFTNVSLAETIELISS